MTGSKLIVALGVITMLVSARPGLAHHSFAAEFDRDKPVTIGGVMTKMEWTNPHGWIYIDVKKPDGTLEHWSIEAGSPNQLIRRGLRKEDFPIGSELLITGYRARNGANTAAGETIKFVKDGRNFFMGSGNGPGTDAGN